MQLRVKGRRVQIIRAKYEPDKGRAVARVVFTVPDTSALVMTDHQASMLTDHERQELEAWFADRRAQADATAVESRVAYAPRSLAHISAAINAASDDLLAAQASTWAAETWAGLDALSKALRRRKIAKPKRRHVDPARDPRQRDLV